jgi:hypothetical protein
MASTRPAQVGFCPAFEDLGDGGTVVGQDLFDGRQHVFGTDRRERRQVVGTAEEGCSRSRLDTLAGETLPHLNYNRRRRSSLPIGTERDAIMALRTFSNTPKVGPRAFVDRSAVVIGDVEIGEDSSVWPLTVMRGDMHRIRIGARTSVQDGACCTSPTPARSTRTASR